jgi:hydrogenase-4 component F
MILLLLLVIPAVAAALIALLRKRLLMEVCHAVAALATLAMGFTVAFRIWRGRTVIDALDHLLRADALSALMISLISLLGAIAAIHGLGYVRAEYNAENDAKARTFFALSQAFIFTMLLAVTTDNLGVMWVAIEGTTLATVFLVNLHNTRSSLEAAYKYLIVSSVGIALAFIGTVLMYYAGASRSGEASVNWTSLRAAASTFNPQVVRLAFAFILVGYGTKVGLAPMHTWLPDAHSEAPAPISALMSGVLLNVGLYALMRFKAIADITLGPNFSSRLLMGMGLLSLVVASAFLLTQRNYKRMLAYSSVEHMGIVCIGLGFGGYWGIIGALLHMINHALSKSLLFMLAGNILLKYRTTEIRRVRGLLRASPLTAGAFLAGTLALVGLPPFGPFISEFMIFRAGIGGEAWIAVIGIALLVVVFAGMLASVNKMMYGEPPERLQNSSVLNWAIAPLMVNFVGLVYLGLTLPSALVDALEQTIQVLGG